VISINSLRTILFVGCASIVSGGWGFVIAAFVAIKFSIEESAAIIWVALPLFAIIFVWGLICLPGPLRRAGIIK